MLMGLSQTHIRIGSRGSRLALWQAEHVAARLGEIGVQTSIEIIQTTGDLDQATEFGALGAKGIFVKEIETALLEQRIDLAVHSLKDLPTELPKGLTLGAVLKRESPLDGLVSRDGNKLDALPPGARVATGSLRRASQILAMRPDLKITPLRGNVQTRIRKIKEGEAEATLLAVAGVRRLGIENELVQVFTPDEITPPMGQGALAIETREGELLDILERLNHPATRECVEAERAFLARIGGGCKTPVGVFVRPDESQAGTWQITGMLAAPDGGQLIRRTLQIVHKTKLVSQSVNLAHLILANASEAILKGMSA